MNLVVEKKFVEKKFVEKKVLSIETMQKRLQSFDKKMKSSKKKFEDLSNLNEKMKGILKQSKLMNPELVNSLLGEQKMLEKQLNDCDDFSKMIVMFGKVAKYVWTHPEKDEKLIITSVFKRGSSSLLNKDVYSFSGPLGDLYNQAVNIFPNAVWFFSENTQDKNKLNQYKDWKFFKEFFFKNFCDNPVYFREIMCDL